MVSPYDTHNPIQKRQRWMFHKGSGQEQQELFVDCLTPKASMWYNGDY